MMGKIKQRKIWARYKRDEYKRRGHIICARQKLWAKNNRDKINKYMREWYTKNSGRVLTKHKEFELRRKMELIEAYGGKCACCGESRWEFMTIDHINGGGADHKRRLKTSRMIYRELRKLGYPKDKYRLLCFNCNCCRGSFGYCPHESEK